MGSELGLAYHRRRSRGYDCGVAGGSEAFEAEPYTAGGLGLAVPATSLV